MQLMLRYWLCIGLTDERIHVPCILLVQVFVIEEPFPQTLDPLLCHHEVVRQIDFLAFKGQFQTILPILKYQLSAQQFPET